MWFLVAILIIAAGFGGYFIGKKTVKPETIIQKETVEVEVPPVDYNEYLEWKQNYSTENVTEIISDEIYTKIETIVKEALDNKFPEAEKEIPSIETSEIKTIKARVKRKKS